LVLEEMLQAFASSTELKVNCNKSMIDPLDVSEERLEILTTMFGCQKDSVLLTLDFPLAQLCPKLKTSFLLAKELKGD